MTLDTVEDRAASVLDEIRGTRDALNVRRVFGDAYELDGTSVIPVARVWPVAPVVVAARATATTSPAAGSAPASGWTPVVSASTRCATVK